jgi:hypothetical protein
MKIREFIELTKTKGWMPIAVADQNEKIKTVLNVKPYLSIKDKKKLVNDIVDETVIYDNGIYKFNGIDQFVVYNMKCIEAYSNLELSDDMEDDYDLLCSAGLLNKILRTFEEEYNSILSLLQMQCDYVLMNNSVTANINVLLTAATAAINKLGDSAGEMFKNVNTADLVAILSKLK